MRIKTKHRQNASKQSDQNGGDNLFRYKAPSSSCSFVLSPVAWHLAFVDFFPFFFLLFLLLKITMARAEDRMTPGQATSVRACSATWRSVLSCASVCSSCGCGPSRRQTQASPFSCAVASSDASLFTAMQWISWLPGPKQTKKKKKERKK